MSTGTLARVAGGADLGTVARCVPLLLHPNPPVSTMPAVTVLGSAALSRNGWPPHRVRDQLAARRWQRVGRAVVLHNGPLQRAELARAVLVNAGPRAALTAFTAAELGGLRGWERDAVHVVIPGGARIHRPDGITVRVHRVADWSLLAPHVRHGVVAIAPALVACAASLSVTSFGMRRTGGRSSTTLDHRSPSRGGGLDRHRDSQSSGHADRVGRHSSGQPGVERDRSGAALSTAPAADSRSASRAGDEVRAAALSRC